MKISQYNWNWWFVLSLLTILIGTMIGMVAKTQKDEMVSTIILIVGSVSILPCLYIGCKPSEN